MQEKLKQAWQTRSPETQKIKEADDDRNISAQVIWP
jgi:hypothetical protein